MLVFLYSAKNSETQFPTKYRGERNSSVILFEKVKNFHFSPSDKLMNIFNSARLPLTQTIMIHMCCQQCRSINNLFRSYFDDVFWAPTISKLFFFNPLILKLDSSYLRLTRVKTNIFIGFYL